MIHENLPFLLLFLTFVAFIAGTIDAVAGGGGLITLPVLLGVGLNPVVAIGTGKFQSTIGELSATLHFAKRNTINYRALMIYLFYTAIGGIVGAILVQFVHQKILEKLIPLLLLSVFIYYLLPKKILRKNTEIKLNKLWFLGPFVGFYNGFFGPGTGTIWSVVLVKMVNLDIKEAIMYAKPLNFIGNIASLVVFLFSGKVYFLAAIFMGSGSLLGGKLGAHIVIYKNLKTIKFIIVAVMACTTAAAFFKFGF